MYWVEVRAWQERVGPPFLVPLGDLLHTQYLGFRSVYAYDADTKQRIVEAGTTAGLGDVAVYSDTLFVDFDNNDKAAREFCLWLHDEGYNYEAWHSGNRSVHVHIPVRPVYGEQVPWSQRCWVERHAPGADLTFYTQSGQFRLPGTRHPKTLKRKLKNYDHPGKFVEVPLVHRPPLQQRSSDLDAHSTFMAGLLRAKHEGSRRVYVWHLAKLARSAGLAREDALRDISWWNTARCRPTLTDLQLRQKVDEVYG